MENLLFRREKQRAEKRIVELEMINNDCMEAIKKEMIRASSIPSLQKKIETLNYIISQMEIEIIKKND